MHSEDINELAAALAKAQKDFKPIKKSKSVKVKGTTQQGKPYEYHYNYAPLEEIIAATREALSKNDLAYTQILDEGDNGTTLQTMLVHSSGQWVASYSYLGQWKDPQKFGGQLTYYRRYALSSLLCISSEDDDDANSESGNDAKIEDRRQKRQPKPAPQNGNGSKSKPPTSPKALLDLVNKRVEVAYDNEHHLFNAIRQESTLDEYEWPNPKDIDAWRKAYKYAYDHAKAKTQPAELTDAEVLPTDHYE